MRAKRCRSGLNLTSCRDCRRLSAGRLCQRRHRSWPADSLHRPAGAVDVAGAGSGNFGGAVARHEHLAGRDWRRYYRACTPPVARARRNLPRHIHRCRVAAARRHGPRNNLAWSCSCAVCGTRPRQGEFQGAATRGNLARSRHGGSDRRNHGGDRHLCHTRDAVRSGPCSSNATNSCRHLVCRLPFLRSRSLLRLHTQVEIHGSLAGASLVALVAARLLGMVLGQLVRGRVRAETFRLWFFIGLLLLGGPSGAARRL